MSPECWDWPCADREGTILSRGRVCVWCVVCVCFFFLSADKSTA